MTQDHAGETAAAGAADPAEADAPGDTPAIALTNADYSVAFTPRNVAIGLAIVAGLVAVALSRRRRGDDRADEVD